MQTVVSLDHFRKNLSDIVARVMYGDQAVLVEKNGKTGVVVMSHQEYEALRDPRKRFLGKSDWERFFKTTDAIRDRMTQQEQSGFERILTKEIRAVRAETP